MCGIHCTHMYRVGRGMGAYYIYIRESRRWQLARSTRAPAAASKNLNGFECVQLRHSLADTHTHTRDAAILASCRKHLVRSISHPGGSFNRGPTACAQYVQCSSNVIPFRFLSALSAIWLFTTTTSKQR